MFRRNSALRCFFCQSIVPSTGKVKDFKCTSCGCWNRYNDRGEIISDEPAMRDEHLNARSFAKRGFPSKDRLPNLYGPAPFCHSCQTNQMLQVNLLSNYLPEPDSPEYESCLEKLPSYRESLDVRYPPICDTCMPLVEDEIHRKEHMARVRALGGWLSKGKERQRRVSNEIQKPVKVANNRTLFWWRLRGCLWALSTAFSMVGYISAVFDLRLYRAFAFLQPVSPFIVVISLLWAVWDPTYAKLQHAQQQSRHVRVQGKYVYTLLQVSVWISRLFSSTILAILWYYPDHEGLSWLSSNRTFFLIMVFIELLSLAGSAVVLRIHQPPSVRLVDTSTHKSNKFRSGTPAPRSATPLPTPRLPTAVPENDLATSHKLVFGHPSLKVSSLVAKQEINSEDMDWTPTNAGNANLAPENENWLRPQRFFPPEKTTGLEGLLECAQIQDDRMVVDAPSSRSRSSSNVWLILIQHLRKWPLTYFLSLVALVVSFLLAKKMSWSVWTRS